MIKSLSFFNCKAMRAKTYTYFIGVDISRNQLDYAIMQGGNLLFHRETENEQTAIAGFLTELKCLPRFTMSKALFCMEATGFYGNHLLIALKRLKTNVVVEDSMHIKYSLGTIRGKNDRLDAIRIAHYAFTHRESLILYSTKSPAITRLRYLFALRNRLMRVSTALLTPLDEQKDLFRKVCRKSWRMPVIRASLPAGWMLAMPT